jgi:type IV secretory pathway VirJ component
MNTPSTAAVQGRAGKTTSARRRVIALLAAGAIVLGVPAAWLLLDRTSPAPAGLDFKVPPSRYGTLHLVPPIGGMRGFVILFSRGDGWTTEDQQAATRLAEHGAFVTGVDTGYYLSHIDTKPAACNMMDGDAETIAQQIQRARGGEHYFTPILAGAGAGGVLAERVLALAPPVSIAGALAVDPVASPAISALPCGTDATRLNGFWDIGATPNWPAAAAAEVAERRNAGVAADIHPLPAGGTEGAHLLALVLPHLATGAASSDSVADLPLVELPAAAPSDRLAVVLSGDGGWRDIDKSIAETLRQDGVSTIGIDSLRYFWSDRTPQGTADDLARVLRAYIARWHARHVALIGYSFGADVLPFAYTRLPADLKARIDVISLIALSKGADFEIRVVGWLGAPPSASALPIPPELARLPAGRVQCIYGADDDEGTACPALAGTAADVERLPGGHHFKGDYEGLTRHILRAWRARIG